VENLEIKQNKRFDFHPTPLEGLWVVQRKPVEDQRGFFCRFFCAEEFQVAGLKKTIAQINHTRTQKQGAVRGMHFQYPPHAEMKLVSCIRGMIWDVAVDLRAGSPTFLQWHAEELSADNNRALLIPEGFAHGFQALGDDVEVLYLSSSPYAPRAEGGMNPQDPRLAIHWPLPITELSARDSKCPLLKNDFRGIEL